MPSCYQRLAGGSFFLYDGHVVPGHRSAFIAVCCGKNCNGPLTTVNCRFNFLQSFILGGTMTFCGNDKFPEHLRTSPPPVSHLSSKLESKFICPACGSEPQCLALVVAARHFHDIQRLYRKMLWLLPGPSSTKVGTSMDSTGSPGVLKPPHGIPVVGWKPHLHASSSILTLIRRWEAAYTNHEVILHTPGTTSGPVTFPTVLPSEPITCFLCHSITERISEPIKSSPHGFYIFDILHLYFRNSGI